MAASIASSKLLNLRNPALQILLRRHLLRPCPAAAQSLNLLHPENITPNSPDNLSTAINQNFHISNLPPHFQFPIDAVRAKGPTPPKDDGDCDDEDVEDDFDDEEEEFDMVSGSEFDDEDEDNDEVCRPIRK